MTDTGVRATSLECRLDALREALDVADGRLPEAAVGEGRRLLARASERVARGAAWTVVALAGATGSGKSSIANVLAGTEISAPGVRRPTTGEPVAALWPAPGGTSEESAGDLLDWLAVRRRHVVNGGAPSLSGLVLIDLPDLDSTALQHRVIVDRFVERADLLVWVLDPQKYADAAVHEGYLRPLRRYGAVMVVVLNQVDRLASADVNRCLADLTRILTEDGLPQVPVLGVSAHTGQGLDELTRLLQERVEARAAAIERLAADIDDTVAELGQWCAANDRRQDGRVVRDRDTVAVEGALASAAGVDIVARAVATSHERDAAAKTGWPLTRWVRRLRPDPLRRLHLDGRDPGARTSLPPPSPAQRARVDRALRDLGDRVAGDLPDPWPSLVRQSAMLEGDDAGLADQLDRAVASVDLAPERRRPRWWSVAAVLQAVATAGLLVGALWLTALAAFGWLALPEPPSPHVGRVPLPTLLLLGGLLAGVVVAGVSRLLARAGGRRRAARARRRLLAAVREVAHDRVVAGAQRELDNYARFCSALTRAATGDDGNGRRPLGRSR